MTKYFTSTQLLIISTSGKIFQPQLFWRQNISTCPSFFCYDEIIFQITNFWIKRLLIRPKLFQHSTWIGLLKCFSEKSRFFMCACILAECSEADYRKVHWQREVLPHLQLPLQNHPGPPVQVHKVQVRTPQHQADPTQAATRLSGGVIDTSWRALDTLRNRFTDQSLGESTFTFID